MKSKIISLLLLFFIKFLFINNCFSQIGNVDTSHILLESPVYDIRNPQFDKTGTSLNYSIKDCLLAYEKWSSGMNSLIAVRFMKYNSLSPEILLTDESSLNIKPSVAYFIEQSTQPENNPGAIVYQTNRNGNWDIYFSSYNMVSWSVPIAISADTADEIEPCISPYKINNALNFMVTYKKGNDIYLKNFFNGVWMNEFNITMNDTSDCFSPVISKSPIGSNGEFFVAYNRRINSNSNQITYQRLIVNSDGSLNFLFTNNIAQPKHKII
ncbi:MAG: hypothetical protein IPL53_23615 [Ignavibacteria bacterium]|nr:hypothetical protein [Ignavibacteria bacterium]